MATPDQQNRRTFLKTFIKIGLIFLAFISGIISLVFLYPSEIRKRELKFFYAIKEEDLPRRGVKRIELAYESNQKAGSFRAFLINNGGKIFALSSVCSHLGCLVEWSRNNNMFACPCHGGKYDIEGRIIAGPPAFPLERIPMKIRNGKVYLGLKV